MIQEVLLSQNLMVQAGADCIDWMTLCEMAANKGSVVDVYNTFRAEIHLKQGDKNVKLAHITRMDPQLRTWLLGPRSSDTIYPVYTRSPNVAALLSPAARLPYDQLFDLMCETQVYGCQDPRDKLFALLSLFDGRTPKGLAPDYQISVKMLYTTITCFFLDRGVHKALSAAAGFSEDSSFPTWVVDW